MRGALVIVSAPSGGGKSTLTRHYVAASRGGPHPAEMSVSFTTRQPRAGERDGEHYHFVDDATFAGMIDDGAFLEHAEVFGARYGTGRARTEEALAAGRDLILDIDWQGARQVRAHMPEAVALFILPPSLQVLEQRLRARAQDDDAVIARRMQAARDEMSHWNEFDYVLVNDDLECARDDFAAIIRAARHRQPLVAQREDQRIRRLLGQ